MIENIINFKLKDNEEVNFENISKVDINAKILWWASPDWMYELTDKLKYENLELIQKKYNLTKIQLGDIWNKKIYELLESMDLENLLKYIKYTKELYLEIFWEEHWMKAYKNFLEWHIIEDKFWHEKFISDNPDFVSFLENELRKIFKYYPKRWDKVWFAIDSLYWYYWSWNIEKMDNQWEINRYKYWMKYWEKWKTKILGLIGK